MLMYLCKTDLITEIVIELFEKLIKMQQVYILLQFVCANF